ncbi:AarF/UbiB family protein [Chloroflexota bacterium]
MHREQQQTERPGIMASLPRRQFITAEITEVTPPMMQSVDFSVGYLHVLRRFFVWIFAGVSFVGGNFWDWARGRNTEMRRAVRLRRVLENSGGTFRKIGRMLAMRIDLLPWTYCVELSRIADQADPFPIEQAIKKIEMATGQPLVETFDKLDPDPIVSSTMFCIYQAYLRNGQKVVVKVRRPKIGEMIMADLKALDWLLRVSEFLSIIRLGFTQNLNLALNETIEDELNFTFEARNQMLFRSEAKKSNKKFFTAPKVFFEYCSAEVTVQEFTEGMWLWELLRAVEQNDQEALSRARELNIDPKRVATRLLWVNFWGLDEHLLFIADLHPDNIIVRKNSKLTFVDFSAIGAMSREKRQALQQIMYYAWKRDPLEMARASMILLEPLPPIDTIKYTKDLEAIYWKFLYALESKHIQWWERTSARLWLGFIQVARDHNITMNIHILRMIRACLLYDMIAIRLNNKIDHVKQYQKFTSYRAKVARQRIENQIRRQFRLGLDDKLFLQIEGITDTGERLFRQLQRFLSTPMMKFNAVLDKPVYSLSTVFKFFGQSALITAIAAGLVFAFEWFFRGNLLRLTDVLQQVAANRFYYLVILFMLFINIRAIIFRLSDKDI